MTPRPRWLFLTLLGIAGFLIFVQANAPSLDVDGVHYGTVAKEIAHTNRWLFPVDPVTTQPYYSHFPLSVWPTAVIFQWFGVSPLTAKLYTMLMALVAVAGIFVLGRLLANAWVGWCAGIAFLLTDHVLRLSRQCRPDLPLIAFMVWAVIGLALAQTRSRAWYLLFGVATLGAIMTKDVLGLVPLGVAGLYLLLRRRWRDLIHPLFLVSCAIAVLPVVGWIQWEFARYQDSLFRCFYEWNLMHLSQVSVLSTPWYYYLWAIWDKYWYFLAPALIGGVLAWRAMRRAGEPRWLIILIWALIFPVGFSVAQHRVHYYILPMYAATALLVGLTCDRYIRETWRGRVVTTITGLCVAASLFLACFPIPVHAPRFAANVRLAPQIDAVIREQPGDLLIAGEDRASLLFYSQVLTRVHDVQLSSMQTRLHAPITQRRYCLVNHARWAALDPAIRDRWELVLDDGARYVLREEPRARTRAWSP